MKTCAQCQAPAVATALSCVRCGSTMFDEALGAASATAKASLGGNLLKWGLGYLILSVVIGLVSTIGAHVLLRNGLRAAAEGLATSPIFLVPLATVMLFAYFVSSRSTHTIAQATCLYLIIGVFGLAFHLMSSAPLKGYLAASMYTLLYGIVGTLIGMALRRKGTTTAEKAANDPAQPR